jgi:hypothetical protein
MSAQGLQRTQQVLQVIGTQLPSIAQAVNMLTESMVRGFVVGALQNSGVEITPNVGAVVNALVALAEPRRDPALVPAPVDDRIADT